jgi:hypothetical protein
MDPASLRRRPLFCCLSVVAAAAALTLVGCGSDAAGSLPAGGGVANPGDTAAAGDNGGGEGAPIRFVSSRNHYRVDFPAVMTEAADGTATASRGTEKLTIAVISGSAASDVAGYARSDAATVQARSPQYTQVNALAAVSLSGRSVQKIVYSWTNGSNAVTGNPQQLVTARYYIPRDASTLAVLTYSIAPNLYDPQGADDVASTFAWQ